MEIKEDKVTLDQKRVEYGRGLVEYIQEVLDSYDIGFKLFDRDPYIWAHSRTYQKVKRAELKINFSFYIQLDDYDHDLDIRVFKNFFTTCVNNYMKITKYPIAGRASSLFSGIGPWFEYGLNEIPKDSSYYNPDFNVMGWVRIILWEEKDGE